MPQAGSAASGHFSRTVEQNICMCFTMCDPKYRSCQVNRKDGFMNQFRIRQFHAGLMLSHKKSRAVTIDYKNEVICWLFSQLRNQYFQNIIN